MKKKTYYLREEQKNGRSTRKWKCKCPRCQQLHTEYLFWTGRAKTPPIFCKECRLILESYDVDLDESWSRRQFPKPKAE